MIETPVEWAIERTPLVRGLFGNDRVFGFQGHAEHVVECREYRFVGQAPGEGSGFAVVVMPGAIAESLDVGAGLHPQPDSEFVATQSHPLTRGLRCAAGLAELQTQAAVGAGEAAGAGEQLATQSSGGRIESRQLFRQRAVAERARVESAGRNTHA